MLLFENLSVQIIVYIVFFALALSFGLLINFLLLKFLKDIGGRQKSEQANLVRWATQTKPAIGGISFFIVFLLSVCSYFLLPFGNAQFFIKELFALLGTVTLGFLVGLIDDAYTMPPRFKFFGQLACAVIMIVMGIYIPISGYWLFDVFFTTIWIVGIMNSINMLDNMDGITGVTSIGILAMSIGVMYLGGNLSIPILLLMLVVMGTLIGFLKLNWNPAKVYMGDSGSQFLGAFLAGVAMLFLWNIYDASENQLFRWSQLALPLVVFVLPIVDSITVSIRRVLKGQSPFVGGRDHTTHNLAIWGLKDSQVALLFGCISSVSLAFVVWMNQYIVSQPVICAILAFMYFLTIFWGVQMIYHYNAKKAVQAAHQIAKVKTLTPQKRVSHKHKAVVK